MTQASPTFSLVRLAEADLPEMLTIENCCFSQPWTEANFSGELERAITSAIGLRCGPELVAQCTFWLITPEIYLLNLAVHPNYRRQGLARHLISAMITIGHKSQSRVVYLEVRPTNAPARNLYKSLGFIASGSRPNYYENGEDAILMSLIL